MSYVPELGGYTPIRDDSYETTRPGVYVAGDACGIEEASSAMIEGTIAGLSAARSLGHVSGDFQQRLGNARVELDVLRQGPTGAKVRQGISKLMEATAGTEGVKVFD